MSDFDALDACIDGLDILRCLDPYATIKFTEGKITVTGQSPTTLKPNKFEPMEWVLMGQYNWQYSEQTGDWTWQSPST
jgi:hypothetical protein